MFYVQGILFSSLRGPSHPRRLRIIEYVDKTENPVTRYLPFVHTKMKLSHKLIRSQNVTKHIIKRWQENFAPPNKINCLSEAAAERIPDIKTCQRRSAIHKVKRRPQGTKRVFPAEWRLAGVLCLFCSIPVLGTLGINSEVNFKDIPTTKGFGHALHDYGLSNLSRLWWPLQDHLIMNLYFENCHLQTFQVL